MSLKPLVCVGSALEDLRELPKTVRRRVGFELQQVQLGFAPSDWRPPVLHVFEKKTRKTTKRDLDLARTRLTLLRSQRGSGSP